MSGKVFCPLEKSQKRYIIKREVTTKKISIYRDVAKASYGGRRCFEEDLAFNGM